MSTQIAVRLADEDLQRLDAAIARGAFPNRAAAVRAGLARLLHAEREAEITIVLITTRVRGLPTEVELGTAQGLVEGSVASCDNVLTIPTTALVRHRGTLGAAELHRLDDALRLALALDLD